MVIARNPNAKTARIVSVKTTTNRWSILTDNWLDDLEVIEGRAKNTINLYRYVLDRYFMPYLNAAEVDDLSAVDPRTMTKWQMAMMEAGIGAGTRGTYLAAVKSFYSWLEREGEVETNPVKGVKAPKAPEPDRHIIQAPGDTQPCDYTGCNQTHRFEDLVSGCAVFDYMEQRERAILYMLMYTGVRIDELASMRLEETDLTGRQAWVRLSKSGKPRPVRFDKRTARELDRYINGQRRRHANPAKGPLFVTISGNPINTNTMRANMKKLGEYVGLPDLHPHSFRHSSATFYANMGMPMADMMELFGWSRNSTMPLKYIRHGAQRRALDSFDKYLP